MRFTRLIPVLAVAALAVACAQDAPTAPERPQFNMGIGSAPLEFPFETVFDAFNPCTAQPVTVTNTGTIWIQPHPNNRVVRVKGTTTMSDGYTGRYDETWTGSDWNNGPGQMSVRTINTQVTNPDGSRYMVHLVWVIDTEGGWTFQVNRFSARCVIP